MNCAGSMPLIRTTSISSLIGHWTVWTSHSSAKRPWIASIHRASVLQSYCTYIDNSTSSLQCKRKSSNKHISAFQWLIDVMLHLFSYLLLTFLNIHIMTTHLFFLNDEFFIIRKKARKIKTKKRVKSNPPTYPERFEMHSCWSLWWGVWWTHSADWHCRMSQSWGSRRMKRESKLAEEHRYRANKRLKCYWKWQSGRMTLKLE